MQSERGSEYLFHDNIWCVMCISSSVLKSSSKYPSSFEKQHAIRIGIS